MISPEAMTRVTVIWVVVAALFLIFVWPDIADAIKRRREERGRIASLCRLKDNYDKAVLIVVQEEIDREAVRLEAELQRRASEIIQQLDFEAEYRAGADGRRIA